MKAKKINNLQISDDNLLRYNKHILLDEIDLEGIEVLQQKHIAVIGLGGLGCPIAQYLVTSGLGNITLIDDDYVESTNLQRQILYMPEDIGKKKAEAAYKRLSEINPNINIHQYYERFTENSSSLIESADLIIEGLSKTINQKRVTYDFERLMEDATLLKCSEFGQAIVENM